MKSKYIIFLLLLIFFTFTPVSGQILNGNFDNTLNHWTSDGNLTCVRDATASYDTTYYAKIQSEPIINLTTLTTFSQDVDVSGYYKLELVSRGRIQQSADRGGYMRMYVGGNYVDLNEGWGQGDVWHEQNVSIIGTGVQTVKLEVYTWYQAPEPYAGVVIRIDNVGLILNPTLSGYVTDESGSAIQSSTVSLSNSGGEDVTNETGYYEISLVPTGTYTISAVATNYERYSGTVIISSDTTQNITMTQSTDVPDVPDVWIPLPIYPPEPTPTIIPDDNATTIIDEIIEPIENIIDEIIETIIELIPELPDTLEKLLEVIEEILTYIFTPFNWLILAFAYLGALVGKYITETSDDNIIVETLLYGTIAWILVLIVNLFISITSTEIIAVVIFFVSGLLLSILSENFTEPEKKNPRRKH